MRSAAIAVLAVLLAPQIGSPLEIKVKSAQRICEANPSNLRMMVAIADAIEKKDGQFAAGAYCPWLLPPSASHWRLGTP